MRILLVEDDRKLAEFVARGLRAERFAVDLETTSLQPHDAEIVRVGRDVDAVGRQRRQPRPIAFG